MTEDQLMIGVGLFALVVWLYALWKARDCGEDFTSFDQDRLEDDLE